MKTANDNVVRALAKAMAAARAGDVEAVAVIAVSADGVPEITFGGETELVPSVNIGVDLLKAHLVGTVMAAQALPTSPIRRAAGGLPS